MICLTTTLTDAINPLGLPRPFFDYQLWDAALAAATLWCDYCYSHGYAICQALKPFRTMIRVEIIDWKGAAIEIAPPGYGYTVNATSVLQVVSYERESWYYQRGMVTPAFPNNANDDGWSAPHCGSGLS